MIEAETLARGLVDRVRSAVLDADEAVELLVACFIAGGHALIEDRPGVGKTTLAKALAAASGLGFARLQCTPDIMPSDVTGNLVLEGGELRFRPGPVFCQLLLADEINRASPRTQSSLLEAMEERQVTIDDRSRPLPKPFMVVATQNPVEYQGTFPLPEAQLDRFMMRLGLGYPGPDAERVVATGGAAAPGSMVPVCDAESALALQAAADAVVVAKEIADYAVALCSATRSDSRLLLGASPRATRDLVRASKALALVRGRRFVVPDDLKTLAAPIMAHRLVRGSEARIAGLSAEAIVAEIVNDAYVPAIGSVVA